MLATVLAGIAAGSYAISPVLSQQLNWGLVFAVIETLLGFSAVASIWMFSRLHELAAWIAAAAMPVPLDTQDQVALTVSLSTIFPTAFLMGMTFPVAARLYARREGEAGSRVGSLYAANVCGAIFSSYTGAFVLIPWLGTQQTLVALAAINLLLSGVLLSILPRPVWPARLGLVLGGAVALGLLATRAPDLSVRLLPGGLVGGSLVWYAEGAEATVSVVDLPQERRVMYLNSRPQAQDAEGPVRLHRLLGHVPMLLHPAPRDVLVIGLGGGQLPGQWPNILARMEW